MRHFFQISFGQSSLPYSESIFSLSQRPLMCICACLSLDEFQWRGLWGSLTLLPINWSPPFWSPESFPVYVEGLLDFKNEEKVVFSVLLGQGLASPPSCSFWVSVHSGWTPSAQPGAHLSPDSLPLVKFWCTIKEDYPQLSDKAIKILLSFPTV